VANKYYKRLSFEQVGDDDFDVISRTRKGIAREITTPQYSVIVSTEGTRVYSRVDQSVLSGAISNRNEIVSLIRDNYPMVQVTSAQLSLSDPYDYVNSSLFLVFVPDSGGGEIKVYK